MRLWHENLLPRLPRAQLLGQHRECAALRGAGWGRRHATVDYVFARPPYLLYLYHRRVMAEMQRRGYRPDPAWQNPLYRGKHCPAHAELAAVPAGSPVYPEHNATYLAECLDNLRRKNIVLDEIPANIEKAA